MAAQRTTAAWKVGLAGLIAVVGVAGAVYSVSSIGGRPVTKAPSVARETGGAADGRAMRGALNESGAAPGSVRVEFPSGTAEKLGMTESQLRERVSQLLADSVSPEKIPEALGINIGGEEMRISLARNESFGGPVIGPAPAGPFEFLRAAHEREGRQLAYAIEETARERAGEVEGVETGRGDAEDIGKAARLALVSPAKGSAAFAGAVRELGGVLGEDGGLTGSVAMIGTLLDGAQFDVGKMRVKRRVAEGAMPGGMGAGLEPQRGRAVMIGIQKENVNGEDLEMATMTMSVLDVWPDVEEESGGDAVKVEVTCPVRLKGLGVKDGWAELGVTLVRDRESRLWQPVAYRVYCRDSKAIRTMMMGTMGAARPGKGN